MARVEIDEIVLRSAGSSVSTVAGASIQVNIRNAGAATVYAAATGGTTLSNPLTSDAYGRIEGWLDEGSYDLVVSGAGLTTYTERFEATSGAGVAGVSALVDLTDVDVATAAVDGAVLVYDSATSEWVGEDQVAIAVDAKGDLLAATAADTLARLPVGDDDDVLTADAGEATGLKWAAPAGGTELGLAVPKMIGYGAGGLSHGDGVGTRVFTPGASPNSSAAAGAITGIFGFDPADYAVSGKTTEVALVGSIYRASGTETAAMALELRPVTTVGGGGNISAFGAATLSLALVSVGAAAGFFQDMSSWVTAPAAGPFALTWEIATASTVGVSGGQVRLLVRHV